jgi:hypothetical protein
MATSPRATIEEMLKTGLYVVHAEMFQGGQLEQEFRVVGFSPESNGVNTEAVRSRYQETTKGKCNRLRTVERVL